jgi:hypothetical protein
MEGDQFNSLLAALAAEHVRQLKILEHRNVELLKAAERPVRIGSGLVDDIQFPRCAHAHALLGKGLPSEPVSCPCSSLLECPVSSGDPEMEAKAALAFSEHEGKDELLEDSSRASVLRSQMFLCDPAHGTMEPSRTKSERCSNKSNEVDTCVSYYPTKSNASNTPKVSRRTRVMMSECEDESVHERLLRKFIRRAVDINELEEPERVGRLNALVTNGRFSSACLFVILLNTVFNTHMYNLQARTLADDPTDYGTWVEQSFLAFYTIELALKVANHRLYFFWNEDMRWNIFDLVLVVQGWVDEIMRLFFNTEGGSLTFVRMLKLLKLGKVFRMLRALRFLKELRVLVQSLVTSAGSMLWSFLMMFLFLYLFSLVFVSQLNTFLIMYVKTDRVDEQFLQDTKWYFGSVTSSMLTLFMSVSGGLDWQEPYMLLVKSGPTLPAAFITFVLFWTFAVMNILGGIFLEKTLANARADREELALQERMKEKEDQQALRRVFSALDVSGDGFLTHDEFQSLMQKDEVVNLLWYLEINIEGLEMFFKMLEKAGGSGTVTLDDFIDNCFKLKGMASSLDVALIGFDLKLLRRELAEIRGLKHSEIRGLQSLNSFTDLGDLVDNANTDDANADGVAGLSSRNRAIAGENAAEINSSVTYGKCDACLYHQVVSGDLAEFRI